MAPLTNDPSKTLMYRVDAVKDINRRFIEIKRVIRVSVVENQILINATPASKSRFIFLRDPEKIDEFVRWLNEQIELEILQSGRARRDHWLNAYIGAAYVSGAEDSRNAVTPALAIGALPATSVLTNPAHINRAELIFTRVFTALKGVTEVMASQMARVLSDGILRGYGARTVAANLNNRVENIGITRARLIARTEIVNAHNVAAIQEAANIEAIIGKKVYVKWFHSNRENPRLDHLSWHNQIFTRKVASARIGLPNCRCAVTAYVKK